MKILIVLVFVNSLSLLLLMISIGTPSKKDANEHAVVNPTPTPDIESLFVQLRTNDFNRIYQAKNNLVTLASANSTIRIAVVERLLAIASNYALVKGSSTEYGEWAGSVLTLGDLREVRAIDVLSGCLDCSTDVASLSLTDYPAYSAFLAIGEPAIPALQKVLDATTNSTRSRKYLAIMLLSKIGGDQQKPFLRTVYRQEKDPYIRATIRQVLSEIQQRQKNH